MVRKLLNAVLVNLYQTIIRRSRVKYEGTGYAEIPVACDNGLRY
jgi:hypothetical protein